ncbi:hypothetical protein L6452_26676 [Arctium lappa]|uniref:Uncharacterized protein n=1 Tax=Arctium lappa TaxID=4217 RepID=A0ACB8ZV00_ARCLA|nr:hypothetical protein L6452_26676 [Arctium lappa]
MMFQDPTIPSPTSVPDPNSNISFFDQRGEFEYVDGHISGKIVVELIARLNKCGVICPLFDVGDKEIEPWTTRLLPSRQNGVRKENVVEKRQEDTPEVVSFEHFPAESSPDVTNEESDGDRLSQAGEDRNHAIVVAVATAATAEAAQAAAKVVLLAGYGRHSKEERASIFIQSYYRGYLLISPPSLSEDAN